VNWKRASGDNLCGEGILNAKRLKSLSQQGGELISINGHSESRKPDPNNPKKPIRCHRRSRRGDNWMPSGKNKVADIATFQLVLLRPHAC